MSTPLSRREILKQMASVPLATAAGKMNSSTADREHITVVGAGAFGVWTALHLLRGGARVTLLDAWGPGNARSSSGGETRVIRSVYGPDRIYIQLVKRAFQLWQDAEARWNTKLYHRTGLLWMFSADDAYARQSLPVLNELGIRLDTLSPAEARKRFPQIDLQGVQTCYFEPEAGYLLARQACRLAHDHFQREGGQVRIAEARPGPIRGGSMRDLVLSDGGRLAADQYVFACGPWLGRLFPHVPGAAVQPSRQEVYFFGTPAGDRSFREPTLPIWIDFGERLVYGIPGAEERGFKVADDTRGEPFDPTLGERIPSREGIERARAFLARRFPGLRHAPLLEARVCQYENSADGNFIIDRHPAARNAWIVGGGSGHGFKFGPALGEYIAARVRGTAPVDPVFSLKGATGSRCKKTQFESKK